MSMDDNQVVETLRVALFKYMESHVLNFNHKLEDFIVIGRIIDNRTAPDTNEPYKLYKVFINIFDLDKDGFLVECDPIYKVKARYRTKDDNLVIAVQYYEPDIIPRLIAEDGSDYEV